MRMIKRVFIPIFLLIVVGNATEFYYENGKKVEVTKLKEQRDKRDNVTYYKSSKGHKIGVKDDILVQCRADIDCTRVLSKYETISLLSLSDKIILVTISKDKNIFKFSQKLYEDEDIAIAHPNFIKVRKRR